MTVVLLLTSAPFATANTLFWDANGSTTGTGGTGTWDQATNLWRNGSTGGTLVDWDDIAGTHDVVFGGTAGTVSINGDLSSARTVNNMSFTTSGYTLQSSSSFTGRTVTLNGSFTLDVASATGNVTIGSASNDVSFSLSSGAHTFNIADSDTATFLNNISGSGGITKTGNGTLILSTDGKSYTGTTTISAGVVNVQVATGLGTSAAGTSVTSGAQLQLQNSIAVAGEALTLNGSGISTTGALRNISGTNSWSGGITLGSASRINSDSGTLTLTGGITGTGFGLTVGGTGATTISTTGINTSTAGTLTKDGDGTLTISASGNYTGTTTISDGIVNIQNATALGTTAAGTSVASGATLQLQGGITVGSEALTLNGSGAAGQTGALVNVSGTNTYGGLITLGSDAVISSDSGTLAISNTGTITGSGFGLTLAGAGTGTLTSSLGTGAGGLTKNGAGTWTITGANANTNTGTTIVNAGQLTLDNNDNVVAVAGNLTIGDGSGTDVVFLQSQGQIASTSVVTINTGGVLRTDGYEVNIGGLVGSGSVVNDSTTEVNDTVLTINTATGQTYEFSGIIADGASVADVGITKTGLGTQILSGANIYNDATTVSAGVLNLRNSSALGDPATAGTSVASGAAVELQNNIAIGAEALSLNGTGITNGGALRNISGTNSWAGVITLGSDSQINSDAGTLTLSGGITGTGFDLIVGGAGNTTIQTTGINTSTGALLTKDGAGTLTISAAGNYTGATTINTGVVNVQNATALGTTAAGTTVVSGAALQVQGSVAVGAEALSLNGTGISNDGAMRNISGTNSWSGAVTLGTASRINSDSGTLTLSGGITGTGLGLTVGGAGNTTIQTNGLNTSTGGTLTKDGAGTLTLTTTSNYTGATTINAGAINIQNASALGTTAAGTTVVSGGSLQVQGGITVSGEGLTLNGTGPSSAGALRSISGNNAWSTGIVLGSAARVNSDANTLTLSGGITGTGLGLTVGGSGNTTVQTTGINTSTGGTLTKDGSGTLTLAVASDYTGLTTVTAGAINVQNVGALGTTAAGTTVSSGGSLQLQGGLAMSGEALTINGTGSSAGALRSISGDNSWVTAIVMGSDSRINSDANTLTLSGGLTGTGFDLTVGGSGSTIIETTGINTGSGAQLIKDGSGTLTLLAGSNYTGATTVSAGVLDVQVATALGTTANGTSVSSGASLQLQGGLAIGSESLSINGTGISSGGALRSISGDNSWAGAITLAGDSRINTDAGTLTITGGITGSGNDLIVGGDGDTVIQTTAFNTGTGTLTKQGTGTLNLAVGSTRTGSNTISTGTLLATNTSGSATGTGSVSVSSGATIGGTGTISGATTLNATTTVHSAISPGNGGPGNLTIGGQLTLGGTSSNQYADLNFDIGTTSDQIDLTFSGTGSGLIVNTGGARVNVSRATGFGSGSYTLFDMSDSVSNFAGITMGTTPSGTSGASYSLSQSGNDVILTITANNSLLSPASTTVNLGRAMLSSTISQSLLLSNAGSNNSTYNATLSGDGRVAVSPGTPGASNLSGQAIGGSGSVNLNVGLATTATGIRTGSITIDNLATSSADTSAGLGSSDVNDVINLTGTVVQNRDLTGGTSAALGRVMLSTNTAAANSTIEGGSADDNTATRVNVNNGSVSSGGITVTRTGGTVLIDSANESAAVSVVGNFSTSGLKSGSINAASLLSNGEGTMFGTPTVDTSVLIGYSATAVADRDLTGGATAALGRVMLGVNTGSVNTTINGGAADDNNGTRVNINDGSVSSGGVTVTRSGGTVLIDTANETASVSVLGNFATSGLKSGSVNVASLLSNGETSITGTPTVDTSVLVGYSATAVADRDLSATTAALGRVMMGSNTASVNTTIDGGAADDNNATRVNVNNGTVSGGGITVTRSGGTVLIDTANETATVGVVGNFGSTGLQSGSINVASLLSNGETSVTGTPTVDTSVLLGYTAASVADRDLSGGTAALGRVMMGSNTASVNTTINGGAADDNNATRVNVNNGSVASGGVTVTRSGGTVLIDTANETATVGVVGNFASTGLLSGSVNVASLLSNGETSISGTPTLDTSVLVGYSATSVANRDLTGLTANLGRVMLSTNTPSVNTTIDGGAADDDNATRVNINNGSVASGGVTVTRTGGTVLIDSANESATVGVVGNFSTAGLKTGSVNVASLLSNGETSIGGTPVVDTSVLIGYTASAVTNRDLTGSTAALGRVMLSTNTAAVNTNINGGSADDDSATRVNVNDGSVSSGGVTVTHSGGTVLIDSASETTPVSVVGNFSTVGAKSGSINVASLLSNGETSLAGTPTLDTSVLVGYTATSVANRDLSGGVVAALGRVMLNQTSNPVNSTINGGSSDDNTATRVNINNASVTVGDITATYSDGLFTYNAASLSRTVAITGNFTTTGSKSGSINVAGLLSNGETAISGTPTVDTSVLIGYSATAVADRDLTGGSSVAFGRVLVGSNTTSLNSTISGGSGSDSATTRVNINNGSTVNNEVTTSYSAGAFTFNGAGQTRTVSLVGNFSTSGIKSGNTNVAGLLSNGETAISGTPNVDSSVLIGFSATAVANRDLTGGSPVDFGRVMVGSSTASLASTINGGSADDNNATRVSIANGSASDGSVTATYSGGAFTFNAAGQSRSVSLAGNFATPGAKNSSVNAASLLSNAETGITGTPVVDTSVLLGYTASALDNRDLTGGSAALGRVMLGANTATINTTIDGGLSDDNSATRVNVNNGSVASGGVTVTHTGGTVLIDSASETTPVSVFGNFGSTGLKSGSVNVASLLSNGETSVTGTPTLDTSVLVGYTAAVVVDRDLTGGTAANLGRVMVGANTASVGSTIEGGSADDNNATRVNVNDGSVSSSGVTVTRSGGTLLIDSANESAGVNVVGNFASAGVHSGSINVAGLLSNGESSIGGTPTVDASVLLGYSATAVVDRDLTGGATAALGRVMVGSNTNAANSTIDGGSGSDNTTTRVAINDGSIVSGEVTASYNGGAFTFNGASQSRTLSLVGNFASSGSKSGNVNVAGLLSNGETAISGTPTVDNSVQIGYTASALNNRDLAGGSAVNFGRVIVGVNTASLASTVNGGSADDDNATRVAIANGSASNGDVTATYSGGAFTFNGAGQSRSVDLVGNFGTPGLKSGSVNAASLLSNGESSIGGTPTVDSSVLLSYSATALEKRVVTASSINFGTVITGGSVSGVSNLATSGGNDETTQVSVANGLAGPDSNGISLSAALGNTFNSASSTGTRTLSGIFTGSGAFSGSFNLAVSTLENGGAGLTGEGSYANVVVNYSGNTLDHASPSLVASSLNFGSVLVGTAVSDSTFALHNASGPRADLALLGVTSSGPSLLTGPTTFSNLAPGANQAYSASINTSSAGAYSATHTFDVADQQDLAGAQDLPNVAFQITGSVYAAASLTANTASTLGHGSAVSISNAAAAPLRATAYVDSYSISPDWTLNNLFVGSAISAGTSTSTASVSVNDTGLLNGYVMTGSLGVVLENDQTIVGATDQDLGTLTWNLSHTVSGNSGVQTANIDDGDDYTGLSGTSDKTLGGTASLLGGSNTSGSTASLTMSWRDRTAGEAGGFAASLPNDATGLVSDVVSMSDIDGTMFVLQMTIDPLSLSAPKMLSWFDGSDWVLATLGNHGVNTTNSAWLNYNGSWAASGAGLTLGAYGYTNNTVWAVLDHNSDFAGVEFQVGEVVQSVPEPSTFVLAAFGLLALGCLGYRRMKQAA